MANIMLKTGADSAAPSIPGNNDPKHKSKNGGRRAVGAELRTTHTAFTLVELLIVMALIGLLTTLLIPALSSAMQKGKQSQCASSLRQLHAANTLYASEHGNYVPAAEDIWSFNLKRWHGTRTSDSEPFKGEQSPLLPYLGDTGEIRACPSFQTYHSAGFEAGCGGYGYNAVGVGSRSYQWGFRQGSLTALNPGQVKNPARVIMFTDAAHLETHHGSPSLIEYSFAEPYYQLADNRAEETTAKAQPSIHFRHSKKANVVWCDGHITSEKMTRSSSRGGFEAFDIGWFGEANNDFFSPF